MDASADLAARNAEFADHLFVPGLRMMPTLKTFVIGCVDPRVDPAQVLGLRLGETAIIRNVGGRVTPGVLRELGMLRRVTQAAGGDLGPEWGIVVLHHVDCGITRLVDQPEVLAPFFELEGTGPDLDAKAVADPHRSVLVDVEVLRSSADLAGVHVTGMVYDVASGRVEVVGT